MAVGKVSDANFEAEVLKSTSPVVVDFWAEWCGPCRMIAPALEEIAGAMGDKVKIVKLNVDENPGVASKYGIMSIPTLMIFKNGEMAARQVGAAPKAEARAVDHHRGLSFSTSENFSAMAGRKPAIGVEDPWSGAASPVCPHGGLVGRRDPGRPRVAIRAEMGRLPLPRVSRRRHDRAAIEIRQAADALFPRPGRVGADARRRALRARRRDRRARWQGVLVRRAAAADSSGGQPRAETCKGNAGAADRVRSARRWQQPRWSTSR